MTYALGIKPLATYGVVALWVMISGLVITGSAVESDSDSWVVLAQSSSAWRAWLGALPDLVRDERRPNGMAAATLGSGRGVLVSRESWESGGCYVFSGCDQVYGHQTKALGPRPSAVAGVAS